MKLTITVFFFEMVSSLRVYRRKSYFIFLSLSMPPQRKERTILDLKHFSLGELNEGDVSRQANVLLTRTSCGVTLNYLN
jgi:hypothetical protein